MIKPVYILSLILLTCLLCLYSSCRSGGGPSEPGEFLRAMKVHFDRIHRWSATESTCEENEKNLERILDKIASAKERVWQTEFGGTAGDVSPPPKKVIEVLESVAPEYKDLPGIILERGKRSLWDPLPASASVNGGHLTDALLALAVTFKVSPEKERWHWAYACAYLAQGVFRRGILVEMAGAVICLDLIMPEVVREIANRSYTKDQVDMLLRVLERIEPRHLGENMKACIATLDIGNIVTYNQGLPGSELGQVLRKRFSDIPAFNLINNSLSPELKLPCSSDRNNLLKLLEASENLGCEIDGAGASDDPFWYQRLQPPLLYPGSEAEFYPLISAYHVLHSHPVIPRLFESAYKARFVSLCAAIAKFIDSNKRTPKTLDEVIPASMDIPKGERALYHYEVTENKAVFSLELPGKPFSLKVGFGE
jgi:hypothetical protein